MTCDLFHKGMWSLQPKLWLKNTYVYSKPGQTSRMELFCESKKAPHSLFDRVLKRFCNRLLNEK